MHIDYPFDSQPAPGAAIEVASGVHWLRMPLPFALDHINLWLLEDGDGYTAVDTGIALDGVKDAWKSALAGRHDETGLAGRRKLRRQIVTHFHPDHIGLAGWLEAETGAPLWMTQGEYLLAQLVREGIAPFGTATMVEYFRGHGLDAERCAALLARGNAYRRGVSTLPATFHRLLDGDMVRIGDHDWRVLVGHGHAPEHASLYCAKLGVLISGDMLLPRISTNISAFAVSPHIDALGLFLDSLDRLTALPAGTLVLPSHGRPFVGLHARVAELQAHHVARCDDLLAACAQQPQTAAELLTILFGRPIDDPHQTMFAMGEAIAHLNHLEHHEDSRRRLQRTIENGVTRYASPR